jgi:hypothetical protein
MADAPRGQLLHGSEAGSGPVRRVHRFVAGDASTAEPSRDDSAIVRRHARVVPVGTVNGKLNGGVPMPEPLSTYRQATSASDEMLPHSERLAG